jgi:hypothetical protein
VTTATAARDATALSELVESPRALKALTDLGYKTLGDVRAKGIDALAGTKHVGQVTLDALAEALGPKDPAPPPPDGSWDEGPHPLHLHSPHAGFQFPLKKARRIFNPHSGALEEQAPLWVTFSDHEGALKAKDWFLRKFDGDEARADDAVAKGTPWRLDAVAWLKGRRTYKKDFFVKTD